MEAKEGVSVCPAGNGSSEGIVTEVGNLAIIALPVVHDSLQASQVAGVSKSPCTPEPALRVQNGKSANGNGKSINLHAFNLFASKVRPATREQNPGATAHEVERLVGQRWANLPELEKAQFVEYAQQEQDNAVAKGLVSPTSGRVKRSKRRRPEADADLLPLLGRRKRGRPSKSELLMRQALESQHLQQLQLQEQQQQQQQLGQILQEVKHLPHAQKAMPPSLQNQLQQPMLSQPDRQQQSVQQPKDLGWMQSRHVEIQQQYYLQEPKPWSSSRSRKRSGGYDGSRVSSPEQQFVGQKVHGTLEGAFSAGYFLTVRVGDTNKVLRGLVFRPGVSIPITPKNDVAPFVKVVRPVVEATFPTQPPHPPLPLRLCGAPQEPVMPLVVPSQRQEEALSAETAQSPIPVAAVGRGISGSPDLNAAAPAHTTGNSSMQPFRMTPAAVSQDLIHQSSAGQEKPVMTGDPQYTAPLGPIAVQVDAG